MLHLNEMIIRYPLTIILSYLFFCGFIKLWLLYVSSSTNRRDVLDTAADVLSNLPVSPSADPLIGGGGQFGGGGASGVFDHAGNIIHSTQSEMLISSSADTTTGVGSSAGEAAASTIEDTGVILIILGLLLAIVCGAGIYLIYEAPAILSEAAFEFILATSLINTSKKMDKPDWIGSIFRMTRLPFLFVLIIAFVFALIVNSVYPSATKLSDVIRVVLTQN